MDSGFKILILAVVLIATPMRIATANPIGCGFSIGLYTDFEGIGCAADFPIFQTTQVKVLAMLPWDVAAITAAAFLIGGIELSQEVIVEQAWESPLTIGDALGNSGFSIAWTTPRPGPIVHIGTLSFTVASDWPGQDVVWCLKPTNDSG